MCLNRYSIYIYIFYIYIYILYMYIHTLLCCMGAEAKIPRIRLDFVVQHGHSRPQLRTAGRQDLNFDAMWMIAHISVCHSYTYIYINMYCVYIIYIYMYCDCTVYICIYIYTIYKYTYLLMVYTLQLSTHLEDPGSQIPHWTVPV